MASAPDSPARYAELEIDIARQGEGIYTLRLALAAPDDAARLDRADIEINQALLREIEADPRAYGRALGEMIFADERARAGLARAQASAEGQDASLRILLKIDADLQPLRWEALVAPGSEQPLALQDGVLLSRLITSPDRRLPRLRPRGDLSAIVAIAAPHNLGKYSAPPLDAEAAQELALSSLKGIKADIIAGPGQASVANIFRRRRADYDILYLIAPRDGHDSEPTLLLEQNDGTAEPIRVSELTQEIARMSYPPRLTLLHSSYSPEADPANSLSVIGYQLAAAGLPAAVVIQGTFTSESEHRFIPAFFRELLRDGQIDRAMARARQAIADQDDWWEPVLLTRLRSGRIWRDDGADPEAERPQRRGGRGTAAQTDPYAAQTDPYAADPPLEQTSTAGPALPLEQTSTAGPAAPAESSPAGEPGPSLEQVTQAESAPLPAAIARDEAAARLLSRLRETSAIPADKSDSPPGDLPPSPADLLPQPPSITVLIQQLEERYRPPSETLGIEIHAEYVHFRHRDIDYTSPHTLAAEQAALTESLALDPQRHGERLFAAIFRDVGQNGAQSTRIGYEQALAGADRELRVELNIYDQRLNRWRWEYLRDPNRPDSLPLATSRRSPLYRRPPIGRDPADTIAARPLKICAAICSPPGLGDPSNSLLKGLAPIDIARQEQIIRAALDPLAEAGLAEYQILGGVDGPPATFEAIGAQLDAGCHVLHLLAHGTVIKDAYQLVIENSRDATSSRPFVSAEAFSQSLDARGAALRLVLLAACQSASAARTPGDDDSLGAELVTGGVPAVIAMQDLVAVNTVQFFTQHFYADLARSGRVDMAMAATRYDLYEWLGGDGPDWGLPVLYMGPGDGRLFDLDLARAARRLPERTPDINSFAEPVAANVGRIAERVREIMAARPAGSLTPPQIDALRAAVAPAAAPAQPRLAPEQDRAALGRLRRPLAIAAAELQHYVESQADRLALEPGIYRQIAAALSIGKHIILTGPPGTGKTSLAQHICRFVAARDLSEPAVFTTASADWTTFDTVGGYVPTAEGALQFRPGIFLRAIGAGRWLVIDEINRAEIDKAFGELFTVLSGQQVDLPYWVGAQQVRIIPGLRADDPAGPWVPASVSSPYDYVVHPNWRIIGAMNVFDRSSLFALSFALMRRFAFIELDVPAPAIYRERLIGQWLQGRDFPAAAVDDLTDLVTRLLGSATLMERRALGPAIIKDLIQHIAHDGAALTGADLPARLAEAFTLYAVPQLDALDQQAIAEIYAELQALFGAGEAAALMLARVRGLYPHIRREEWPQ